MDEDEKKPEEQPAEDEKPEEQPAEDEKPEQPAEDVPDFASIADLLTQVLQGIADMRAEMATALKVSNAAAIDNGAAIVDDAAAEPDVEIVDDLPELAEDRDYSI